MKAIKNVTLGPSGDVAWILYETTETFGPRSFVGTAVVKKTIFTGPDCALTTEAAVWTVAQDHRSMATQ